MSHKFQNIKYHGLLLKKRNGAITRTVLSGPIQSIRCFIEREFTVLKKPTLIYFNEKVFKREI